MKETRRIPFNKFTLVLEKGYDELTERTTILLSVEDISYDRGCGLVLKQGDMKFYSHDFLASNKDILYLPGKNTQFDLIKVTPHPSLLLEVCPEWVESKEPCDGNYYDISGLVVFCKEIACKRIIDTKCKTFLIERYIKGKDKARLEKWTSFAPIQINGKKLTVGEFWLNYTNIGWLLLACRVVVGDYRLVGKLREAFIQFKDDHFFREKCQLLDMTGQKNWQHHFLNG